MKKNSRAGISGIGRSSTQTAANFKIQKHMESKKEELVEYTYEYINSGKFNRDEKRQLMKKWKKVQNAYTLV